MVLDVSDAGFRRAVWAWFLVAGHADGSYGIDPDKTEHIRGCGVDVMASGIPDFEDVGVFDSFDSTRTTPAVVASATCRCGRFGVGSTGFVSWVATGISLSELIQGVARAAATDPGPETEGSPAQGDEGDPSPR